MESTHGSDKPFWAFNVIVSVAAVAFLTWLTMFRTVEGSHSLAFMPTVNAAFNSLSAILIVLGWRAIRNKNKRLHRTLMLAAFVSSAAFLIGYLVYHAAAGDTPYQGVGAIRLVYFFVLISHIVLSVTVLPLCLAAFYFAFSQRFEAHKKLTRWLMPIWLYVSVTGVIVYLMLHVF